MPLDLGEPRDVKGVHENGPSLAIRHPHPPARLCVVLFGKNDWHPILQLDSEDVEAPVEQSAGVNEKPKKGGASSR